MQNLDTIHDYLRTHSEEIGESHFVFVSGAVWCRRGTVSIALAYAPRALSGPNPGNYGRQQAVAVGEQCKRCCGVRLWQDAHCSREHVGS